MTNLKNEIPCPSKVVNLTFENSSIDLAVHATYS
jgi:hypothetical protein